MKILVFIALAALTMVACVAPKPKEKGVATTKRTKEQAHKTPPTMKDSTPAQHLAVPDTTSGSPRHNHEVHRRRWWHDAN